MNKYILFVMRDRDNPELFTEEEKNNNKAEAFYEAPADYDFISVEGVSAYDAATASYYITSPTYDTSEIDHWLSRYFQTTGEDRQEYADEVERLKGG